MTEAEWIRVYAEVRSTIPIAIARNRNAFIFFTVSLLSAKAVRPVGSGVLTSLSQKVGRKHGSFTADRHATPKFVQEVQQENDMDRALLFARRTSLQRNCKTLSIRCQSNIPRRGDPIKELRSGPRARFFGGELTALPC
jgi:hypothetical protein